MDRLRTYVIQERGVSTDAGARAETTVGAGRPERLLLLLHGYGATEHDFTALGPLMDPGAHFLIAGARGPVAAGGGAAWFEHGPMGPDPETFHASLVALERTVDHLCAEHLLAPDEVVIGGFSQGAAMALALGLAAPGLPPMAGVICHSGYVADVAGLEYDWERAASTPVLVQHGRRDEVVPIELARDGAAALAHHGLAVTFIAYDAGHQATVETLADARDWLDSVRRGGRPHAPVAEL